ncbi:hypothetical protein [Microbacter margulisiae]|uniref:Uncharacterized protein n=1 Tax=Microbacter margulisiae TaxID=1350067 RepID=A0A7W5DSU7_9PORP|nr:hypothetical protein [Microbacter margulisiae]MBB3188281.1 hypothetical protein [Microbacter margulisiae]
MGLLIISCGNSDQQKAQELLNRAQLLYNQQHYNQAKLTLDSVNVLFPQMIPMRQKADTVMYRIELQEAIRDLRFADSTLVVTQHLADSCAHPFLFTKNTKYDEIGQYTLKSQQSAFYATHTFLKPIIDENGTLTIMSVYCGSPIGHTTVRASANGVFAETNPASKSSCFSYSNQGKTWENVNFTGKDISGLVSFIANNLKTPVEISLEGGRRIVRYVIPQADKEGILQAYHLSEALKEVRQLKLNVLQSKQTIVITCGHLHLDPAGYIPIKTVVDKK